MQRLGTGTYGGVAGYGGKSIVHVEPDLSGYAEQAVLDPSHCFNLFGTGCGCARWPNQSGPVAAGDNMNAS